MAISDMKGTVSTTGIMNDRPVMPKGDVNPQLEVGSSQPLPVLPNKEIATGDDQEMTPIENEIVKRANTLTDEDKENFVNILSPSVVGTLSKLLPEFADTMEQLSSGEPNVIFPLSTIQRYAQTQYGGEANEALQTFVSDVMKPDVDNFAQQLETQQTNVPPGNQQVNTTGLMQADNTVTQPNNMNGMMTSPQNMETV